MPPRTTVFLLLAISVGRCLCVPVQRPDPFSTFRQSLHKLVDFSPDPCTPGAGNKDDFADVESPLFQQAARIVTHELNQTPARPGSPRERAEETLKKLERLSAEVNAVWPEDNRFHFEILDLPPLLVTKMTLRSRETFVVFGVPENDPLKSTPSWREVGSPEPPEYPAPRIQLELYPLHRSPSRNARFLAKFDYVGCAGSTGVAYDARDWNPKGSGSLDQIIKQSGSFGLDDKVTGFPQVGTLQTKGPLITLPYCWFSTIDTWDNPSLCAVDTYDLSGDDIRFNGRTYNRPDLVPIAKTVEYAQQHDYPAVLAYCTSSDIARRLVRDIPPHIYADDLRLTQTGKGKEHVEFGSDRTYRFDMEMLAGRWLVAGFSIE